MCLSSYGIRVRPYPRKQPCINTAQCFFVLLAFWVVSGPLCMSLTVIYVMLLYRLVVLLIFLVSFQGGVNSLCVSPNAVAKRCKLRMFLGAACSAQPLDLPRAANPGYTNIYIYIYIYICMIIHNNILYVTYYSIVYHLMSHHVMLYCSIS